MERGGTFLWAGAPGPAKLVALLQFVHAGLSQGERCLILTSAKAEGILDVARAWGFPLEEAWEEGRLEILGFRDDFEMRVMRSTEPEDTMEELGRLVSADISRVAVDPGSLFLGGGARTLVGRAFLDWAREHPATVWATLSVEGTGTLPSAAEWLVHDTNGVFLIDRRSDGLYQVRMHRAVPAPNGGEDPVTLQLDPGKGLVAPDRVPSRRRSDRPAGDPGSLLLVSLGQSATSELDAWARSSFQTQVVTQALDAVASLQGGATFGGILIHATRAHIREAAQVCRAMRPLTSAAIVVASDDTVRSTDRVDLLQAGADDCLSGGVDFRELAARIQQAMASGGKSAPPRGMLAAEAVRPDGGMVAREVLVKEVARRASDPLRSVFSLLRIDAPALPRPELAKALEETIRSEEGDLVACGTQECLVLLQGARREPSQTFLTRLGRTLARQTGNDPGLRSSVLVHPAEADRIREVLTPTSPAGGGARESAPGEANGPQA
jgi:CheY-like chemotaxis protein